jgi:hypothetical protein
VNPTDEILALDSANNEAVAVLRTEMRQLNSEWAIVVAVPPDCCRIGIGFREPAHRHCPADRAT